MTTQIQTKINVGENKVNLTVDRLLSAIGNPSNPSFHQRDALKNTSVNRFSATQNSTIQTTFLAKPIAHLSYYSVKLDQLGPMATSRHGPALNRRWSYPRWKLLLLSLEKKKNRFLLQSKWTIWAAEPLHPRRKR